MRKTQMIKKTSFSVLLAVCIICCLVSVSSCGISSAETETDQNDVFSNLPVASNSGKEIDSVGDNETTNGADNAEGPLNVIIWKKIAGNSESKNANQYIETDQLSNGQFIVTEERTEAFDVADPDNYQPTFIFSDDDPFDSNNSISYVNGEAFIFAEDGEGNLFSQFVKFDPDSIIASEDGLPLVEATEDDQPHRLLVTITTEGDITKEQLVQKSYDIKKP